MKLYIFKFGKKGGIMGGLGRASPNPLQYSFLMKTTSDPKKKLKAT